jgi:Arylsulfatase A and related enzymes
MVDQLAAKWLETAAEGVVDLPAFDELKAEGTTFVNAFSSNPVCSPSRASIATGLSSSVHGVAECGYDLDPGVPTFMQGLQAAGFTTGGFGKLHFLPQIADLAPDYRPYGFDVVENTEDSRAGLWLDWVHENHPEHYEAAQSTVWMTMIPELESYGPDKIDLKSQILAARQKYPESATSAYELPFPEEVSQTAWITGRACEFIESAEGDIFAQISYIQPHSPFAPPAEYVDCVNVERIPEPLAADWLTTPIPYYKQQRYSAPTYETEDWRRQRQLYFADLAHLDHELARVRESLRKVGRDRNVLFIFTSDHGELLHDHGLIGKWERHYDTCIRVPLVVTGAGAAAREVDSLVEHVDIAPTIYEWSGVNPPRLLVRHRAEVDQMDSLSGHSLLGLMNGEPTAWPRETVYIQSNNGFGDLDPRSWSRTVRTSRYRYTRHLAGGGEQLFDLHEDPDEQRSLVGEPSAATTLRLMQDVLVEAVATDTFPNTPVGLYQVGAW